MGKRDTTIAELRQDLADTERYLAREKAKTLKLERRIESLLKTIEMLGSQCARLGAMHDIHVVELQAKKEE